MQTLDVVNQMLGTMGEKRLASLEEPHAFKGDALATLNLDNRAIQATGWWFNTESLTLNPMLNGRIILAGDFISVRTCDPTVVQRGQYLYDLSNGTDIFTEEKEVTGIRLVPFDSLPETVASYIGWSAILKFQMLYDGDTTRMRQIEGYEGRARAAAKADDIRNKRVNIIDSNQRLVIMQARRNMIRRW